ncbi:hypothetical protein R3W88_034019 [Solanum pinnatisectum]|uniref:Uncharacterized protein n=1 Tax=Solanum pinnatisectum TaxID=50273 RepID=A0AAV9K1D3_9SOLN|nr:hypothetical protein R3W88_034019 [Solanum pinnatisectum]
MRETRTKISDLKEIRITVFKERFEKKQILICHPNLLKSSLDIRLSINSQLGNCVLVINPLMRTPREEPRRSILLMVPPSLNRSMNIIIWNCRGANGPDFRRNFLSLLDWHKPPLINSSPRNKYGKSPITAGGLPIH